MANNELNMGESNRIRNYDAETQKALENIDACQNDIDALSKKACEEMFKIEQKYNKLMKPYFKKRNDFIKQVRNFWLTVFVNHSQISALLNEDEKECLHYFSKLEVEEFEDIKSGYRIKFFFDENAYFENDVIVKEFHFTSSGEPVSQSTQIKWKEDMNLTEQHIGEQAKAKSKQKKRYEEPKTFFRWFADHRDASADDIAEVIKDNIWPNPLPYFLVSDLNSEKSDSSMVVEEEEQIDGEIEVEVKVEDMELYEVEEETGEEAVEGQSQTQE